MKIFDKVGRIAERVTDRVQERVGDLVEDTLLPESVRARLSAAESAINQGRWQDALDELDKLPPGRQGLMRVALLRGMAFLELDRTTRAIHHLEAAVRERETVETAYFLGLAYERAERPSDARNALLAALRHEPRPALLFELLSALGRVYLALERPDRAERELRGALRERPGDAGALTLLAVALRRLDQHEAAIELLESHRDSLHDVETWILLGQLALERGDFVRADAAFARALERGERISALEGAARCALEQDDLERTAALLERARWHGEASTRVLLLEAELAWRKGDAAVSAQRFAQALEHEPGSLEALLGSGRAALVEPPPDGDPGRALRMYQRARSLAPRHAPAMLGEGRAHLRLGDRAAAMRALEEARALEPGPEVLDALAELARRTGSLVEALVLAREAEQLRERLDTVARPDERIGRVDTAAIEAELRRPLVPPLPFDATCSPARLGAYLTALRDHMAGSPLMASHVGAVADLVEALEAPLDIAVLGEFNAGKSTLVNAWLGEPVVATGVLPTTAHVNVIRYGARRVGRLVLEARGGGESSGEVELLEMPYGQLAEAVAAHHARIRRIEYLYPHPELRAVHFIDTPGFNAAVDGHEDIAAGVLRAADAILWLIDVNQVLSSSQLEVLERVEASEEKVLVLLNKIDALEPDEEAELVDYLGRNFGDKVRAVLPISALEAFRARNTARAEEREPDPQALERAHWPRFEQVLRQDLTERSARLKAIEAVRRARELAQTVLADAERVRKRLELMAGQMAQGRDALERARERVLRSDVVEIRDRFETQRDVALRSVAREVDDARRPSSGWLSPLQLSSEDLGYLLGLLQRRLERALDQVGSQVLAAVTEPVEAAMQTLEWVAGGLVSTHAQVFFRRLEGFVAEERMARRLLEERVLGRHRAALAGRVEALADDEVLAVKLGSDDADEAARRTLLERVAGTPGAQLGSDLSAWITEYFAAALHLCDNVRRDIERLRLDVRFNVLEPFGALLEAANTHGSTGCDTDTSDATSSEGM